MMRKSQHDLCDLQARYAVAVRFRGLPLPAQVPLSQRANVVRLHAFEVRVSQAAEILARLQGGETVTPADAYERHGCLALHSRIAQLRGEGWDIRCHIMTRNGRRWGEYRLRGPRQMTLELAA